MTQKKTNETKEKSLTVTLAEDGGLLINSETMTVYEVLGALHGAINILSNPQAQATPAKTTKKAGNKK